MSLTGADLLKTEPFLRLLAQAQEDEWDGIHGGPPCGTFSRARWNRQGPVRSRKEIYGLSTNNVAQQKQADEGTLLASRTIWIVGEVLQSQRRRRGHPEKSAGQ